MPPRRIETAARFCEYCSGVIKRRAGDGPQYYGRRKYCDAACETFAKAKFTPKIADAIRDLYFVGKIEQPDIARAFGVSQATICKVIAGRVPAYSKRFRNEHDRVQHDAPRLSSPVDAVTASCRRQSAG